jgi:hypothetical protein
MGIRLHRFMGFMTYKGSYCLIYGCLCRGCVAPSFSMHPFSKPIYCHHYLLLDFTQKLMERFDRKDPEIHFRELAQLKQVGTPGCLHHRVSEACSHSDRHISEQRLVMLFTKGLSEPLRGWVKAFKPETLQDAIIRTRDMEDAVPKTKTFSKPFIPRKNKDKKPFQKEGTGKEKMDEATRNELRRKKLCFNCKDPWEPGHTGVWAREGTLYRGAFRQ